MAKGPVIPDMVQALISAEWLNNPQMTAKEIQRKVNISLRKSDPSLSNSWPGVSAVLKIRAQIYKGKKKKIYGPSDKPFSLLSSEVREIPPEILPDLMSVNAGTFNNTGSPLTTREARWFSRLYYFSEDKHIIANWASIYAGIEAAMEVLGKTELNSDLLDFILCSELGPERKVAQEIVINMLETGNPEAKRNLVALKTLMKISKDY
jgi:hypothetical protein